MPEQPKPSLLDAALADDLKLRDSNSENPRLTLHSVERGIRRLADEKKEWAGMPLPLNGETLIVEKSYPFAAVFNRDINQLTARNGSFVHVCRTEDVDETTFLRNSFWSSRWHAEISIWQVRGKIKWGPTSMMHGFTHTLSTLGCADAWRLETEFTAMAKLRELVSFRAFRQYLLTGTFIETSKRSHVVYMFRRLRPTVAMHSVNGEMKILCALCLHPIAYYCGSWAGAMCPTDDVIAHLMLMRGDEHMFWRRANQHPAYRPEAGL